MIKLMEQWLRKQKRQNERCTVAQDQRELFLTKEKSL